MYTLSRQLRTSVLDDPATETIYATKTGKSRVTESGVDTEYTKYVMDNWAEIGVAWFNAKVNETVESLKVSACNLHCTTSSH